ncbi:MAG: DUF86 domain-containing protein [Thermoanaerobaculia bacterium]|nr:DUF86 domain-containing protein [Thermoanaerobaculia bacterium]
MTFLVERLAELDTYLAHLRELESRVSGPRDLERDLSLRNDVLFSLLTVCQLVIDLAGELSTRKGLGFEDYTEAVRNLRQYETLDDETVDALARLQGFRNVVIHEYVSLDLERVVEALGELAPVADFARFVAGVEDA